MPYLGAHQSVSKGLHLAFDRIAHVGGEALQISTRNQRQWNPKPLQPDEVNQFKAAREKNDNMIVASHASYLVNLASGKDDLRFKSINNFITELKRCQELAIPYGVIHPGSHGGDGVEAGIERFIKTLDEVIDRAESSVMVLVETTAGQGTSLGSRFEELAYIRNNSRFPDRIGICLDTCHIFASGYDIRNEETYMQTMNEFDQIIGLQYLYLFHLNDSKKDLSSRVDRHEHIGKGCIGLEGFRNLLNDQRFVDHPMTLETPKGEDLQEDIENLATLRALIQKKG